MSELTKIGMVLFAGFVLTAIWKFRESKWIKNFQKIVNPDFDAKKNRTKLHQWGFIFFLALFSYSSYSWLGLTWVAAITGAISGVLFWIMDIELNVLIGEAPFHKGKTATMDKIPFWARFILLGLLVATLMFIV